MYHVDGLAVDDGGVRVLVSNLFSVIAARHWSEVSREVDTRGSLGLLGERLGELGLWDLHR